MFAYIVKNFVWIPNNYALVPQKLGRMAKEWLRIFPFFLAADHDVCNLFFQGYRNWAVFFPIHMHHCRNDSCNDPCSLRLLRTEQRDGSQSRRQHQRLNLFGFATGQKNWILFDKLADRTPCRTWHKCRSPKFHSRRHLLVSPRVSFRHSTCQRQGWETPIPNRTENAAVFDSSTL